MRNHFAVPFASAALVALSLVAGCHHRQVAMTPTPAPSPKGAASTPEPKSMPTKEVTESFPTQPVSSAAVPSPASRPSLETIYFDYDKYDLTASDRQRLQENATWLRAHPTDRILVAGNCDERGTVEYNLALGERRARAARRYLIDLGVPASRIDIVTYGKERPVDPGHDEAAWAKNRRDDFTKIVPGAVTANIGSK